MSAVIEENLSEAAASFSHGTTGTTLDGVASVQNITIADIVLHQSFILFALEYAAKVNAYLLASSSLNNETCIPSIHQCKT